MNGPDLVGRHQDSSERLDLLTALVRLPHAYRTPCAAHPETWFSKDTGSILTAVRGCQGCPVRWQCLDAAHAQGEEHGVWGGVLFPHARRPSEGAEGAH
ncbi:WhiB family transcriptional regulator [Streptomyces sp. NPDC046374]|uniref:WhiB family transcriptional regulator n=1 Tax=Streptomyces sp. NPDC046374 TaxID=3154917 RepID=UPI0033F857D3